MKALKRRPVITRGVIIFSAIVLALAIALPALAEGPGGHGSKPDKAANRGQPAGGAQSGNENPGQSEEAERGNSVEVLPENNKGKPAERNPTSQQPAGQPGQSERGKAKADVTGSRVDQGQTRSDQAGSQGQQGQGKAQPDQASSPGNKGKANLDPASSQGKRDQARLRQAGSHSNKGKANLDLGSSRGNRGQARLRQAGSQGKKGKANLDLASSRGNRGQAQGWGRSEPGLDFVRPGPANTQKGRSGLQANQALGAEAAFASSIEAFELCRYRGKPQSVPFSNISQGGSVVTISNTGGLKNLRIAVNGRRFQVSMDNQAASTTVDVDVLSALLASDTNSIVFTALGKPGTCATVSFGRP